MPSATMRIVTSKPVPRLVDSWQIAEENAAAWMRYWGFTDAKLTGGGSDGGVDVRADPVFPGVVFTWFAYLELRAVVKAGRSDSTGHADEIVAFGVFTMIFVVFAAGCVRYWYRARRPRKASRTRRRQM